ncbi:protein mbtH [Bacillus nakamurai]|uniref:Protein mbtH n=1 Tax=Bacillus nakamurai TaxID=1793963 RepID=A0A150F6H3_9BACI|nr:MbtH family protein [Bacillus nakamurai]KXZ17779.1 protein mbtH [Bacillus nakamurai]KXZ24184.1 protein mbtH [Bacillus nakamurai]MED1227685.1 MbtH family protein [Bacillus nakamurai]
MTNPFEQEDGIYHVLVNAEGQYSLWPAYLDVPDGWEACVKDEKRKVCLEYIETNWRDMRPESLKQTEPAKM